MVTGMHPPYIISQRQDILAVNMPSSRCNINAMQKVHYAKQIFEQFSRLPLLGYLFGPVTTL